jgi:hypothetical protein
MAQLDKHLRRDSPGNSPADRPKELTKAGDQAVLAPETVGQKVSVGLQASAGETLARPEIEKAAIGQHVTMPHAWLVRKLGARLAFPDSFLPMYTGQ